MLSTCVRFFSAVLLVALTAPIASADLPTRELIDPLYLAGDPIEPDGIDSGDPWEPDGAGLGRDTGSAASGWVTRGAMLRSTLIGCSRLQSLVVCLLVSAGRGLR